MILTLKGFREIIDRYPAPRALVAYSGGLDSTVLLDLCHALKEQGSLTGLVAVHANHGLHSDADKWEAHCRKVCDSLTVDFVNIPVDASPRQDESPEEAARRARYEAFKGLLGRNELLLTAHHRDDQTETVLLRLFRGAGIEGLSAMPEAADFGGGRLLRPLLSFPRTALEEFARKNNLIWIEDPSNQQIRFDRNLLRLQVIPELKKRWPSLDKTVFRTSRHCAEAKALLELRADELLQSIHCQGSNTLQVSGLKELNGADARLVIRRWIVSSGYRVPSSVILRRILNESIGSGLDRVPYVAWGEAEVNRYQDKLYLCKRRGAFDAERIVNWNGKDILEISAGCGGLQALPDAGSGIAERFWNKGVITVRFRQGGERCKIANRRGTRTLKKLFQEGFIPPWVRDRIPLVHIDGQLASVADLWVCEPFAGAAGEEKIALRWFNYDFGWKSCDSGRDVV